MTPKEQAAKTIVLLQERRRTRERKKRDIENYAITFTIQSIKRHRGKKDLEYFY